MNCCRETVKMTVPLGTVPRYRGIGSEPYLNGTSQVPTTEGRPASGSESLQLGEKDGHIHGRSRPFMKHRGCVSPCGQSSIHVDLSQYSRAARDPHGEQ